MTQTATVSDAAVQAAIKSFESTHNNCETYQDMRRALTVALPHLALFSAPCSVEVKKLEWVDYYATTEFGAYTVGDDDHGWFFTFHDYPYGEAQETRFDLIDDAKADAQADFDRRILSAIVTKPVDVAAVRRQALEEIAHIATQQKEYWDNKQRECRSLEDAYSENGDTYTPLGDDEAWKAGYANGHFSEACWLLGTIRALSPAEPAQGEQWQPTHKHVTRGTEYRVECYASLQAEIPCEEGAVLVIYRGEDGKVWARLYGEFNDGRFTILSAGRTTEGGE